MTIKRIEAGSYHTKRLPKGCTLCRKGAKMVLLVTGKCSTGCFYCPLSLEKKGRDVIFANERKVIDDEDIVEEASLIDSEGTGITGGDPVQVLELTERLIRLLRRAKGKDHHLHLYTSTIDLDAFRRLEEAGLDELRLHPPIEGWSKMDDSRLEDFVHRTKMSVGFEVPAIPGRYRDLKVLILYADRIGMDFVNLNELEFSEGNWKRLKEKGMDIKNEVSSAVKGSEEMARRLLRLDVSIPVHYCSSSFKDTVQLRRRIERRARNVARPFEIITDDGTLLKGVIEGDAEKIIICLQEKFEVPMDLFSHDKERQRVEIAPWVLEDIRSELPFDCFIVEEYPTADRLEVEREPLSSRRR